MAYELFGNYGDVTILFVSGADNFPIYFWSIGGNAAINFAIEVFNDLRTALGPPHLCRFNFFTILQLQRIWEREWRNFGIIVICRVRRICIAVSPTPQSSDMEQVHGALMVLLGSQVDRRGRAGRSLLTNRTDTQNKNCWKKKSNRSTHGS